MFSGLSVVEPSGWRWTALASFTLQAALVAMVLIFPILWPQSLAPGFLTKRIFVPIWNGEVQAAAPPVVRGSSGPSLAHTIVVSRDSPRLPVESTLSADNQPPGPVPSIGIGDPRSAIATLLNSASGPIPPPVHVANPPRVSVVMEGNLIRRVDPQYPAIARQIRLQGVVVLNAIVSREGNIEHLQVASGPAMLAVAAKDAVERWKYRPYLLNGEPVEVETQTTVNFTLGQ